jgi:hypothetical protein
MRFRARFVVDQGVGTELCTALILRLPFGGVDQDPSDSLPAKFGIHVPSFEVGHHDALDLRPRDIGRGLYDHRDPLTARTGAR